MLNYLTYIANALFPYRAILYFIAFALAGTIVYLLQGSNSTVPVHGLTTYLVGLVWLLLLNAMLHIFYQPGTTNQPNTWFGRFKQKLLGLVQKVVVGVFIVISLAVIYLTFKLLRL